MEFDYNDSAKLRARREFYNRFSIRSETWDSWILNELNKCTPLTLILDVGGGYGSIWSSIDRERFRIIHTDLSVGMLKDAEGSGLPRAAMRAEQLAVKSESVDILTAFNVLYHVQDRKLLLSEASRTLKRDGVFIFTTTGSNHLLELREVVSRHTLGQTAPLVARSFPLEEAVREASVYFEDVRLKVSLERLVVDEVQGILDYIRSTPIGESMTKRNFSAIEEDLRGRCSEGAGIEIRTESGMIVCKNKIKKNIPLKRRENSKDCPFCHEHPDRNEYWIKVADFNRSKLCLTLDQTYTGQCLLIYQGEEHAESLDELSSADYLAFTGELRSAIAIIRNIFSPNHINVELLGNVEPHLHFHIIPRYHADPRWTRPIWLTEPAESKKTFLAESVYAEYINTLRGEISRLDR